MKPVIGIMPLWDEKKDSLWMLPGYADGVMQAGGLPVIFPLTAGKEELEQLCGLCDGFLFTGGHDVEPSVYGEESLPDVIGSCGLRDDMEREVLAIALAQDKPVLGICRGLQFLNAALGGTLYQDLPTQHPSEIEHNMKPPYERAVHTVRIEKETPLFALLGKEELGVNTRHHQAVKDLAPGLVPMAASPDGLIEAFYLPDRAFVWGIQWHPEILCYTDGDARRIFSAFVDACK